MKICRNLPIAGKLTLVPGAVFLLLGIAMVVVLNGIQHVGAQFQQYLTRDQVLTQAVNHLFSEGLQMGQARGLAAEPGADGEEALSILDKLSDTRRRQAEAHTRWKVRLRQSIDNNDASTNLAEVQWITAAIWAGGTMAKLSHWQAMPPTST